jgi:predicted phosphodiesterase
MRYAVLSDIHGNLEAFETALKEIESMEVDRIVSLGDMVGYNANPNECLERLVEHDIPTILGNHDAAACGLMEPVDFNPIAKAAILWTRQELKPTFQTFLREQPEERSPVDGVRLVHGSLLHRDHYLLSSYDIQENVKRMRKANPEIRILFFGHTHYQVAYCQEQDSLSMISSPRFSIEDGKMYLINPGSVGQPRDQDPRAAFLLYDEETGTVEFVRLSYNILGCTRKILSAGLPSELADRLHMGW